LLDNRSRGVLSMKVRYSICTCTGAVWVRVVTLEGIWMTVLTTSGLWDIGHNLHTTWNGPCRSAAAGGVCRGCWSSKALCELLNKGHSNIVRGNVNSVGNTKDDEGPLSGEGKTSIRRIEASSRGLLNFTNTATTLAND
jgi:hypothetical protein